MNFLPLAPESNAVWSQRFGSLLTSLRMPNPSHQHKMTFHSSGKCPLLRLLPSLCNSLNKEVAIFPRWRMGSVWPRSLELWLLSLFWMKTVRLTAHNCWPPYKRRDIRPLKIMAGLLGATDNLLLATLVPKQFDSADFYAHLEMLLTKTSASTNCELCAEPQRLPGLHLWGPPISRNQSSWTRGRELHFFLDSLTAHSSEHSNLNINNSAPLSLSFVSNIGFLFFLVSAPLSFTGRNNLPSTLSSTWALAYLGHQQREIGGNLSGYNLMWPSKVLIRVPSIFMPYVTGFGFSYLKKF